MIIQNLSQFNFKPSRLRRSCLYKIDLSLYYINDIILHMQHKLKWITVSKNIFTRQKKMYFEVYPYLCNIRTNKFYTNNVCRSLEGLKLNWDRFWFCCLIPLMKNLRNVFILPAGTKINNMWNKKAFLANPPSQNVGTYLFDPFWHSFVMFNHYDCLRQMDSCTNQTL